MKVLKAEEGVVNSGWEVVSLLDFVKAILVARNKNAFQRR